MAHTCSSDPCTWLTVTAVGVPPPPSPPPLGPCPVFITVTREWNAARGAFAGSDIWLAVHHSITFLLLPTWYTNLCIKLVIIKKVHRSSIGLHSKHTTLQIRRHVTALGLSVGDFCWLHSLCLITCNFLFRTVLLVCIGICAPQTVPSHATPHFVN